MSLIMMESPGSQQKYECNNLHYNNSKPFYTSTQSLPDYNEELVSLQVLPRRMDGTLISKIYKSINKPKELKEFAKEKKLEIKKPYFNKFYLKLDRKRFSDTFSSAGNTKTLRLKFEELARHLESQSMPRLMKNPENWTPQPPRHFDDKILTRSSSEGDKLYDNLLKYPEQTRSISYSELVITDERREVEKLNKSYGSCEYILKADTVTKKSILQKSSVKILIRCYSDGDTIFNGILKQPDYVVGETYNKRSMYYRKIEAPIVRRAWTVADLREQYSKKIERINNPAYYRMRAKKAIYTQERLQIEEDLKEITKRRIVQRILKEINGKLPLIRSLNVKEIINNFEQRLDWSTQIKNC